MTGPGPAPDARRLPDLAAVRETAVDAARSAGALLRQRIDSIREVRHKGAVDLVTDVDVQSERLVRERILRTFPDHTILGEEGGSVSGQRSELRWIVDPLDGTTNYAHGFPFFCVSIGFEAYDEIQVGVIYDPNRDELFVATRGAGSTINGRPLSVSAEADLTQGLLATGFPYDRTRFEPALRAFGALSLRSMAVRRAGSAALDLCYVAAGRFEAYWELAVMPWDVAAGALLVQEAGGRVTRVDGSAFSVQCGEVLASNGLVHDAVVQALANVPAG